MRHPDERTTGLYGTILVTSLQRTYPRCLKTTCSVLEVRSLDATIRGVWDVGHGVIVGKSLEESLIKA